MNQSPMGWYEDDDAPGLARWWDGDRWTEHTMALPAEVTTVTPAVGDDLRDEEVPHRFPRLANIFEPLPPRTGPAHFPRPANSSEPLPPRTGPTRFPRVDEPIAPMAAAGAIERGLDPTSVGPFELGALGGIDTADSPFFALEPQLEPGRHRADWRGIETPAHRWGGSGNLSDDRFVRWYRDRPLWARITAPALAVVLMVGLALAAVHSSGSSSARRTADTSDATFAPASSSTTAVTFVPLGPPPSAIDSSSTSAPATTSTTATHAPTTRTPVKVTTTTAATTTTRAPATTTTTATTTAPPPTSSTTTTGA